MNGIVLDAGGLIGLERGDRRVRLLGERVVRQAGEVVIPATALAQVSRNPSRQVGLARLVQRRTTQVVPLDKAAAQVVGLLLARTGAKDIADAHVVVCARERGYEVATSDPGDLKRLDPSLAVVAV